MPGLPCVVDVGGAHHVTSRAPAALAAARERVAREPAAIAEVAFGVEDQSQSQGYATEALTACVEGALAQPECRLVRATTTDWHKASKRLLERIGMRVAGERHDGDARMLVYEKS